MTGPVKPAHNMSGILVLILRIALTIALYGFIAWAIYTIWRDLKQASDALSAQSVPAIHIRLLDPAVDQPRSYKQPEVIIGRDPSCDFSIADSTVSAQHALLKYHHHQWWVEDQHSTNGTFLNKEQLLTPTVIVSGDELRCGQKAVVITIHK